MYKLNTAQIQWFDYLLIMTKKEIKSKYKNTTLGFLWIFINPLSQMLIMGIIFGFFIPVEIDNYFLFLFTGLLPWNFFSHSILQSTPSIVEERDLVKKSNLNREVIVLSRVLSNMFHFLMSLFLLLIFLVISQLIADPSIWHLAQYVFGFLRLIPYLIWILVFTSGLALLFSAVNVRFRDLNFIVNAIVPLWFYATPITYSLNLLPSNLTTILSFNPITPIIEGFQSVLLSTSMISEKFVLFHILVTLLLFMFAVLFFKKENKDFADWI